jgi:hypothetical protein
MFVLTTDHRTTVSTEKELTVAFDEHRDRGHDGCFQLHGDDGEYLSAIGEGFGPYFLEWFPPAKTGIHLRVTEELKSQEVLVALYNFLRGDSAWRESHAWHEVEDERPPWPARFLGWFVRKTEKGRVVRRD